jgi:hypothetical protein
MTTAYHRDFDRLCALLKERGPIAFSMRLAQITGHPKDAVLLSQLVYWTRHGRDVVASQGWIHKTREQWFAETGLSREEQENIRRRLRRLNLAQEWRGGRPARLYFRIHTKTLSAALCRVHQLEQPVHLSLDFMRGNEHAMRALFGPSVAFHRVLAEVTGSVNAALMLSRMIQLQRHTLDTDCQWFSLTASEWSRDCGLKRRQFENAKHKLHQLGLIEEFVSHERHRRVFSRVHPVRLLELLRPIIQRISIGANATTPALPRERTSSSRKGGSFVQTLDRRHGAQTCSVRGERDDIVKTLDTRHGVVPPPLRDGSPCFVRTLDSGTDAQLSAIRSGSHVSVKTLDTQNGGPPYQRRDSAQTLDKRYGARTCSVCDERYGAVKTLDTQNDVLGPPRNGSPVSVKTLDMQYCTLPSPAHDAIHDCVQTLDTRNGVQPSPAREGAHVSVKTLDTQNRARSFPARDSINFQKPLTNFSQPEKLDGEKRTLQSAGFVHRSRRETYIANARAYTTTSTNTPTTTAGPAGATVGKPLLRIDLAGEAESGVVVGQEHAIPERDRTEQSNDRCAPDNRVIAFEPSSLIWPVCVHAAERRLIAQHLARVPQEARQIMLDEMAACHRQHPVKWPVAYVGSLVKRYQAGDFIPAKAHLECEYRRLAAARQLALREREEQFTSQLPPASSPETARHNLAALRDALRRHWGQSGGTRDQPAPNTASGRSSLAESVATAREPSIPAR